VQVESAKEQLEKKRKAFPDGHERRRKVCGICPKAGHNKAKCKNNPCCDVSLCRLKDKHPERLNDIRTLQRDLKELEQKYGKAKKDNDVFQAARKRAKSSFFAIMRPRLKCQNPAKYVDRGALDRDLMVLQRALQNKTPVDQADDWRLPSIIEEYKRGNVHPNLSTRTVAETPTDLQQPAPSFSFDSVWLYNRSDSYWLSECYVFYYTTALMLCSQMFKF